MSKVVNPWIRWREFFTYIFFLCNLFLFQDGKQIGPSAKRVEHLEELDRHPDDDDSLEEGSKFKDRVFLSTKRERTLVGKLAKADIEIFEFLQEAIGWSENGILMIDLVRHIDQRFQNHENGMPSCYRRLLANLSKVTSVSGFLQVTRPETLDILESFCNETLDLRSSQQSEHLKLGMVFFAILDFHSNL